MRILGVSVIGLVELAASWQEREEARRMANGKTTTLFGDRAGLRAASLVGLDEGREFVAPTRESPQERG